MGIVKARKLSVSSKIFLFSKTVKDYGNRSADIFPVMQAVRQAGHTPSMQELQSLCMIGPRLQSYMVLEFEQ